MLLKLNWIFLALSLGACASSKPKAPLEAQQVNADIEERIMLEVEKGRERGFPDLAEVRVEGPELEPANARQESKESLLTSAEMIREETKVALEESRADTKAEDKATKLLEKIERDRKAVEKDREINKALREEQ